jgi:ubiquinone biosynthesis UbiH/UbiF/VisC/COQ6 family hydroxylase
VSRARIVVAGGGPVGLAFACACTAAEVHVLEASGERPEPGEPYDVRIYALSSGSRALLRDVGAWEHLDAARVAPVRRMEVFGDGNAKLAFSGRAGAPLAWIAEAGRLSAALEAQAATLPHVTLRRGARTSAAGAGAAGAWAELEGGERVAGDLLVAADGPGSHVRALLGLEAIESPYGETAVVANFEAERPHGDVARQWFRADGVLAWLPLPGRRISIVWSAPAEEAARLTALEPRAFERRVREAGAAVLGDLQLISAVAGFPLRLIRVPEPVAEGVALIGDAAHAVHPLAGQGVNLGFQDARVLAEALAERSPLERPGDLRVLRRYARARREDVSAMQFVTDRLDRLFASEAPGVSWLRNAGLRAVDVQPWAKAQLAARAMR